MKKIFPILLLAFTAGAWASIIYRNFTVPNEYEKNIADAQASYEEQYYLEALSYLDQAGELQGITASYTAEELRRNIYEQMQDGGSYEGQCRLMVRDYPEVEENYERLVQYYWDNGDYNNLCGCLNEFAGKWPDNAAIAGINDAFSKMYDYVSTNYYDVRYATTSMADIQKLEYETDGTEDGVRRVERMLKNSSGKEMFDLGYAEISVSMDAASCFVRDQEGVWTRVDAAGHLLAKNEGRQFEWIGRMGENNIATALCNGEYHFINHRMEVSDLVWEDAGNFSEGINAVKKNGKWALVTTEDWSAVTEFHYTDIPLNSQRCAATGGVAVVADAGGYRIIDTEKFEPVSENVYEELKAFESGQPTAYRKGSLWGFVNYSGEVYIEAAYEDAKPYMNGYAAVKRDGLWGFIDSKGTMVVEPQFQETLGMLPGGVAYVRNDEGYWDYITMTRMRYEEK